MTSPQPLFDFALGPVQGFVGQARRTRDLWSGSFLLSFLAGHAMAATRRQGGRIAFPVVEKDEGELSPLLAAIEKGVPEHASPPYIGSLPNRFRAKVPTEFDPAEVEEAVRRAWGRAARAVWDKYFAGMSDQGEDTEAIWQRQVDGFWEMTWVLEEEGNGGGMDARKNWRLPPSLEEEGGDHCTMMHDLQELSGWTRAGEFDRQVDFWSRLRSCVGKLDLREDEQLCAVALVKRLFPQVAKQAIGWPLDVRNWPSTAYMAAVPWIEAAHKFAQEQAVEYAKTAADAFAGEALGERNTALPRLSRVDRKLRSLDGNAFHANALANDAITPLREDADRDALRRALRDLNKATGHAASSYYALLLMDGDRLGALLRDQDAACVSRALARFTDTVPGTIDDHSGVTVYAGGDDVLALLPFDTALSAARTLEQAYRESFRDQGITGSGVGLSGALIHAHYKQPLATVLKNAHYQLDEVAKESNGRASLAVAVIQGVGVNMEWVAAFEGDAVGRLEELVKQFQGNSSYLSGRFVQGLRNLFGLRPRNPSDEKEEPFADDHGLRTFLVAELMDDREQGIDRATAEERIRLLLPTLRRQERCNGTVETRGFQADGVRLARFLARMEEDT